MAKTKAFKITQNNQYIQPITLNAGEYTFSAWIRADDETYKFGLRKMDNQLLEFDLSDQLVLQQWAKVRLTFHLTEKVKEFSLMSSGAGNGKTYHVVNPMFEEGSNAGTPKPNELDIEEQVEIGSVTMTLGVTYYVFEFEDNKTGSETIDIPVYVVRNGTYVDIPATDISISSTMPAGMTAVFEQNNIKLTVNDMASKNGQLQINVSVGGIGYIGYFNWRSVSDGKDGAGIAIKGTVDNYAALALLTGLTAGDSYFNNADGMLYVWDGTAFPPEGQGILFQGKDGESSIIADLDNEIQSISVDTDGTYMFGLPISTKFSIYAGATSLMLDSLSVQSISGVTATAVKETGIVTVTAVAKTVPDKIDLKITGKATVNSIQYTREAYLTINKIKRGEGGEKGDSPVLYELQPSVTQIKKLANGTLIPSTIYCRMIVTSASGSYWTTTLPFPLSAQRSLDNGETWSSYSLGTSIDTSLINTSVRFRLYQQTDPITMLDIETIMIVEDGEHGEDGNSPFIGANGNWYVWDSALKKYVDSGDSAQGDDGKSPEIRDGYWWAWDGTKWYNTGVKAEGEDGKSPEIRNGYWWVYENGQWSNTGIKAEGENAKWLKLNSTATQIKVDRNNNSLPASITVFAQLYNMAGTATWTYSVDGGNFTSTLPTGVARTGNRITVTSANVTFQVLSIKAVMGNAEDTVSISRVVDGERGVPGKSPVTKEYRVGQTYYNNDVAIHYVYYRVGNSWWKLKDSVESHTASTSAPSTVYFEQLSSVEVMVAETIIAENANLAEFIFKDKTLFSQQGTNSAGDSIKLGEYVQFQFGIYNSTTPPASNWSGWNNTPPTTTGNYLWIRYKITSESVWAVKRVTGTDPDFTVQFGALKDGTFFNPPYQAGRNWMKMSDGRVYAITEELALGDYDPNLWMDGKTGNIGGNNLIANNVRARIHDVSSFSPTNVEKLLAQGKSVNLSVAGEFPVDYDWYEIKLPSDKEMSGTILTIHAPMGSVKRYKIKSGSPNGMFYVGGQRKVLSELQVVPGVRQNIELKGVWDDLAQTLDWVVLSRVEYMMNGNHVTINRYDPVIEPNTLIYRGLLNISSSTSSLTKHYQSYNDSVSVRSTSDYVARIRVGKPLYWKNYSDGSKNLVLRNSVDKKGIIRVEITPYSSTVGTPGVSEVTAYDSAWEFMILSSLGSGNQPCNLTISLYTNDYLIQSNMMDDKLDGN